MQKIANLRWNREILGFTFDPPEDDDALTRYQAIVRNDAVAFELTYLEAGGRTSIRLGELKMNAGYHLVPDTSYLLMLYAETAKGIFALAELEFELTGDDIKRLDGSGAVQDAQPVAAAPAQSGDQIDQIDTSQDIQQGEKMKPKSERKLRGNGKKPKAAEEKPAETNPPADSKAVKTPLPIPDCEIRNSSLIITCKGEAFYSVVAIRYRDDGAGLRDELVGMIPDKVPALAPGMSLTIENIRDKIKWEGSHAMPGLHYMLMVYGLDAEGKQGEPWSSGELTTLLFPKKVPAAEIPTAVVVSASQEPTPPAPAETSTPTEVSTTMMPPAKPRVLTPVERLTCTIKLRLEWIRRCLDEHRLRGYEMEKSVIVPLREVQKDTCGAEFQAVTERLMKLTPDEQHDVELLENMLTRVNCLKGNVSSGKARFENLLQSEARQQDKKRQQRKETGTVSHAPPPPAEAGSLPEPGAASEQLPPRGEVPEEVPAKGTAPESTQTSEVTDLARRIRELEEKLKGVEPGQLAQAISDGAQIRERLEQISSANTDRVTRNDIRALETRLTQSMAEAVRTAIGAGLSVNNPGTQPVPPPPPAPVLPQPAQPAPVAAPLPPTPPPTAPATQQQAHENPWTPVVTIGIIAAMIVSVVLIMGIWHFHLGFGWRTVANPPPRKDVLVGPPPPPPPPHSPPPMEQSSGISGRGVVSREEMESALAESESQHRADIIKLRRELAQPQGPPVGTTDRTVTELVSEDNARVKTGNGASLIINGNVGDNNIIATGNVTIEEPRPRLEAQSIVENRTPRDRVPAEDLSAQPMPEVRPQVVPITTYYYPSASEGYIYVAPPISFSWSIFGFGPYHYGYCAPRVWRNGRAGYGHGNGYCGHR